MAEMLLFGKAALESTKPAMEVKFAAVNWKVRIPLPWPLSTKDWRTGSLPPPVRLFRDTLSWNPPAPVAIRFSQPMLPVSGALPLIETDSAPDIGLNVAAEPDQPRLNFGKLAGEVELLTLSDGSVAKTFKLLKVTA